MSQPSLRTESSEASVPLSKPRYAATAGQTTAGGSRPEVVGGTALAGIMGSEQQKGRVCFT